MNLFLGVFFSQYKRKVFRVREREGGREGGREKKNTMEKETHHRKRIMKELLPSNDFFNK